MIQIGLSVIGKVMDVIFGNKSEIAISFGIEWRLHTV